MELSYSIEFIQWAIIQLMVEREIIPMTPEQTAHLISQLRHRREQAGLSVNEVARRAKVDPGTAWRIEQGMISTPRAESLIAIGRVLDIPSADIFATVGWLSADELPSIGPYLRTKYDYLPDEAVEAIESHIAMVLDQHDTDAADDRRQQQLAQPKES
ncbi:helix-turn-helix domain-containing protein [Mycobacteroides abscessus]|uniref:helix-turn-helix domain-containing protein n=1 Tax=Mycobacteroides abscessus TaxID=36809 RepID=UPI00266C6A5F|nr:helix-turn-helix transcriptional regulator [Mycobacteroides abscessus]MDO3175887.1 helix-turn-helix transcriptional regulator [Mycobacteroides abscessus subsp. abscessus]